MKASELVAMINAAIEKHGDREITLYTDGPVSYPDIIGIDPDLYHGEISIDIG